MRPLGQAHPAQRSAASGAGREQHEGSGQVEARRTGVSRPRNHLACAYGTPTVMENAPASPDPVCVEHQNVPAGVSVYW